MKKYRTPDLVEWLTYLQELVVRNKSKRKFVFWDLDEFRKLLKEYLDIKWEARNYILELEVYLWFKFRKGWELERSPTRSFDFKVKDKEIYIEVKVQGLSLSDRQIVALYEFMNRIEKFYVVTRFPESEDIPSECKLIEEFETSLGTYGLYELNVREFLRKENRLLHSVLGGRCSRPLHLDPVYYGFNYGIITERLRSEGLIEDSGNDQL